MSSYLSREKDLAPLAAKAKFEQDHLAALQSELGWLQKIDEEKLKGQAIALATADFGSASTIGLAAGKSGRKLSGDGSSSLDAIEAQRDAISGINFEMSAYVKQYGQADALSRQEYQNLAIQLGTHEGILAVMEKEREFDKYGEESATRARNASRMEGDAAFARMSALDTAYISPFDSVGRQKEKTSQEIRQENDQYSRMIEDMTHGGAMKLPAGVASQLAGAHDQRASAIQITGNTALSDRSQEMERQITRATEDAYRSREDMQRDSLQRGLKAEDVAYARELEDLKGHNELIDKVTAEHQARRDALIAKYSTVSGQRTLSDEQLRMVLDDPNATMAQGLRAGTANAQAHLATNAELGAQIAQIGVKTGDSVTQGIDSALEKSIESGSFKGFAAALQQSTEKAIIDGAVEALTTATIKRPMEQAFSSLTGGASSIAGVAGSASGGRSGAVSPAAMADDPGDVFFKSARMSPQQVHIYVSDKAAASIQLGGTNAKGVPKGKGARR